MNVSDVKDLIKFIGDTDITEVSLESAGVKLSVRKGGFQAAEAFVRLNAPPANGAQVEKPAAAEDLSEQIADESQAEDGLQPVIAPMVVHLL
ncbi:MAG: hypothetical protein RQM92_06375 [Candidatus Syntrophopropionicum ammoniitolerans]